MIPKTEHLILHIVFGEKLLPSNILPLNFLIKINKKFIRNGEQST